MRVYILLLFIFLSLASYAEEKALIPFPETEKAILSQPEEQINTATEQIPLATTEAKVSLPDLADFSISIFSKFPNNTDTFKVGDKIDWQVIVEWTGGLDQAWVGPPEIDKLENLQELSRSTTDRISVKKGQKQSRKIFTFTFMANEPGPAKIGTCKVEYTRTGEETKHILTTREEKLTINEATNWGQKITNQQILILIVVGIIVLLIIIVSFIIFRRNKKSKVTHNKEPKLSREEKYLLQLDEFSSYRIQGDIAGYFRALRDWLKEYLLEISGVSLTAATNKDLLSLINDKFADEELVQKVDSFLSQCDEGRFSAGNYPSYELDSMEQKAKEIINKIELFLNQEKDLTEN